MEVTINSDGIVKCKGKECRKWIHVEETCNGCPIDQLFGRVNEDYMNGNLV